MSKDATKLDRQARMLIQASEPLLRHWLGVSSLDRTLIGTLYLRQRRILEHWYVTETSDERSQRNLVEQLAVAMFMTATAWQTAAQPAVDLLSSLREIVAAGLPAAESNVNAPEGEA